MIREIVCLLLLFSWLAPARAHEQDELLKHVAFDQKLNAQVPLNARFRNEEGQWQSLGHYFKQQPVLLVMGYYDCPNLCGVVWQGLLHSLRRLAFDAGKDYQVLAVSIDPHEGPALARSKKAAYLQRYGRSGAGTGFHFLTGGRDQIQRLARSIGYRYVYDPKHKQYEHAAGIVLLTPRGRISRYFYGIDYPPRDLRLGLVEASGDRIGSPVDQLLLFCCQYDPSTGKYTWLVWNIVRLAASGVALILAAFLIGLLRRERRKRADAAWSR